MHQKELKKSTSKVFFDQAKVSRYYNTPRLVGHFRPDLHYSPLFALSPNSYCLSLSATRPNLNKPERKSLTPLKIEKNFIELQKKKINSYGKKRISVAEGLLIKDDSGAKGDWFTRFVSVREAKFSPVSKRRSRQRGLEDIY